MATKWTRRETLLSFLGAGILSSTGCYQNSVPVKLPPGELAGAADKLGHRIRDLDWTSLKRKPAEKERQQRILIIGGGIAGLSAARKLARDGHNDFAVLELEPAAGGTARSGASNVSAFPWGAHYVPAPRANNKPLIDFLSEMDVFEGVDENGNPTVREQFACRDPHERLYYKGEWFEGIYLNAGATREDVEQFKRFQEEVQQWVAWKDEAGNSAFRLPLAYCSNAAEVLELDKISMDVWMQQRGYDSERLLWYVDYACRDDYGLRLAQTSAWAALFYFASRMDSQGESRPFITWPAGNGQVVQHLARKLSGHIHSGWAVVNIATDRTTKKHTVLALQAKTGELHTWEADRIIFAAPRFLGPYLLESWRESPPEHVRAFRYGAWAVINLTLKKVPQSTGFPLSWDNVLYDSPSLGYVSATFQGLADQGAQQWTYYYPLCDADERKARTRLLEVDRDGWVDIALTDLERAHASIRDLVTRADVMRWGHAMIQPRPGFVSSEARGQARASHNGIYFAHSDMSGVALIEEAFYRGTIAAEQLLRDDQLPTDAEYFRAAPSGQLM